MTSAADIIRAIDAPAALFEADGRLIANAAKRYGFTSSEILRNLDGGFDITISPEVQPGNWLPVAPDEPFILALRLFDTSVSASTTQIARADMPRITKGRCA